MILIHQFPSWKEKERGKIRWIDITNCIESLCRCCIVFLRDKLWIEQRGIAKRPTTFIKLETLNGHSLSLEIAILSCQNFVNSLKLQEEQEHIWGLSLCLDIINVSRRKRTLRTWREETKTRLWKKNLFFFACSISRIKVSFKRVEKFTFSILRHTAYWNDTFWQRRGRFPIWKVTITSKTSLNVDCIVKKYFFPIFIWVKNCAVWVEYQVLLLSSSLKKKGRRQGEALYVRTYLISETCFDF